MGEEVREAVSNGRRQCADEVERLEGKANSWGSRAERGKGGFCSVGRPFAPEPLRGR